MNRAAAIPTGWKRGETVSPRRERLETTPRLAACGT
jgi:hypothetical protein